MFRHCQSPLLINLALETNHHFSLAKIFLGDVGYVSARGGESRNLGKVF